MRLLVFISIVSLVSSLARVSLVSKQRFARGVLPTVNDVSNMRQYALVENGESSNAQVAEVISEQDNELTEAEDNMLIQRLNEEIFADVGVELEQLINPSKVVNLERDLIKLERQKLLLTNQAEIEKINEQIEKKKSVSAVERRLVMRGWLKNLFVGQSVLSAVISLGMVYNSIPGYDAPLPIQVLGFWMWWLFIVPSLRARKPSNEEKSVLNIAFLVTPVVSFALPTITRDCPTIWWANALAVAGCYAYAFLLKPDAEAEGSDGSEGPALPSFLAQAYKALDYGSGQERGARK